MRRSFSAINAQLPSTINQQELIEMLRSLDQTNNKKLSPKFVTKHEARSRGWKAGEDLWSREGLRGSSIGGDQLKNLEGRLPNNKWWEADLNYKGGHRGGKRLIFSRDGRRFVTVDHYRTFVEYIHGVGPRELFDLKRTLSIQPPIWGYNEFFGGKKIVIGKNYGESQATLYSGLHLAYPKLNRLCI